VPNADIRQAKDPAALAGAFLVREPRDQVDAFSVQQGEAAPCGSEF